MWSTNSRPGYEPLLLLLRLGAWTAWVMGWKCSWVSSVPVCLLAVHFCLIILTPLLILGYRLLPFKTLAHFLDSSFVWAWFHLLLNQGWFIYDALMVPGGIRRHGCKCLSKGVFHVEFSARCRRHHGELDQAARVVFVSLIVTDQPKRYHKSINQPKIHNKSINQSTGEIGFQFDLILHYSNLKNLKIAV